ncbi:MAG: signal peptide peptidase SppA [Cellvibrionaceae bacterium]|nr:signal peptide peptidase SppA [Cellvibrionaceae bacterium]
MEENNRPKRSVIGRFFGGLWAGITWLRRLVLNLLFLLIVIAILAPLFMGAGKKPALSGEYALRLAPAGYLVDQYRAREPMAQLLQDDQNINDMETRVWDLVKAIRAARDDKRINAIVLELDYLAGGGISKLEEVGQALEYFKAGGKPVYAMADYYDQDQYYLAAFANEIYVNPMGGVALEGYSSYRSYFKSALESLEINMHVFKVGQYKDAVEPLLRDDMSEASREHNAQWLGELWGSYASRIEGLREMPAGAVNNVIENLDTLLKEVNGDGAQLALQQGFVDKLLPRHAQRDALAKLIGQDEDYDSYRALDYQDYLAEIEPKLPSQAPKIGLLVASGTILDGEHPEGTIGGDTMAELIRNAQEQDLEALIFRVDSGGGSAFASEVIRQQLLDLQNDQIPVIVSMGSVAASGGYWISASSDEVWATPTTITGSIGVFGAFPTLEKSLAKLGINNDGLGTTKMAGQMRLDRPLSPLAKNVIQQGVEHVYQQFIGIVAEGRGSDKDNVHKIAQGRVWSGAQAQELGLVDKLGSLQDVIEATAADLKLEDYQLVEITRQLSPAEKFMQELAKNINASAGSHNLGAQLMQRIGAWLAPAEQVFNELNNMNDPKGVYARCFDCRAF